MKWNNGYPKYDIRRWDNDGKPLKGITIEEEELSSLLRYLKRALSEPKSDNPVASFMMRNTKVLVLDCFGELAESGDWKKIVSYVDWGYGPKIDIRTWQGEFEKAGKGVTLTDEECRNLISIIREITGEPETPDSDFSGKTDIDDLFA